MRKGFVVLTVLALAAVWVGPVSAAQQTIAGQNALLKNPKPDPGGDATKRSVKGFLKENASPNTIVGNPMLGLGARLKIKTDAGEQCYNLLASGWSLSGSVGYKYKDSTSVNSAIKTASIKKPGSGQFQVKANGKAKVMPITIIPPTGTLAFNLAIANGDEYCGAFSLPTKNDTKQSKFGVSADPGVCAATSCFFCGDGVVTGTEACDSSGVDTAVCDGADCTLPVCGDGYTNAAAGEACDTSGVDTAVCDGGDCSLPVCGDIYVNAAAGEVCDPDGSSFGSGPPADNGICDNCLSPSGAFLE